MELGCLKRTKISRSVALGILSSYINAPIVKLEHHNVCRPLLVRVFRSLKATPLDHQLTIWTHFESRYQVPGNVERFAKNTLNDPKWTPLAKLRIFLGDRIALVANSEYIISKSQKISPLEALIKIAANEPETLRFLKADANDRLSAALDAFIVEYTKCY